MSKKPRVLVLIPIRPGLNPELQARCSGRACALPLQNPTLEIMVVFDYREMDKRDADRTPWSKVARVRNRMLHTVDWMHFDYVLWIDADVIDYPPDLPTRFIAQAPLAITAPLVLVEGKPWFYDTCAFIIKGQSGVRPDHLPEIAGRNLAHAGAPYWPVEPTEQLVEMDCVGTLLLVPTRVYLENCDTLVTAALDVAEVKIVQLASV